MRLLALAFVGVALTSCGCDRPPGPEIAEGTYVEREADPALGERFFDDAVAIVEGEAVTIEYTGDDGHRYRASYRVVNRTPPK